MIVTFATFAATVTLHDAGERRGTARREPGDAGPYSLGRGSLLNPALRSVYTSVHHLAAPRIGAPLRWEDL